MTCGEVIRFLGSYVDEELPADVRRLLEEHLAACPKCPTYLDTYRRTVDLAKGTAQPPDPALAKEIPEELVRAILTARRKGA